MPKTADIYFKQAEFEIIEEGFDPGHSLVAESVFSLANEFMGVRGYIEEGTPGQSLRGTYLNGVYELAGDNGPGGYKGIVKQTHYMVTCADVFFTCLDAAEKEIRSFSRVLDMRSGLLKRETMYETEKGRLHVTAERLLSMAETGYAAQRLTFQSDQAMVLCVTLGIDGSVTHQMTQNCLWQLIEKEANALTLQTATTGQSISYAYRLSLPGADQSLPDPRCCATQMTLDLKPGQPVVIEKTIAILRDADTGKAKEKLSRCPDFETLLAKNREHYAAFWNRSDIDIGGDLLNRQGIRFCLFQLHQTYRGAIPGSNIGAKGLTGEAYNGHAFWDTETYCLAHYLLTDPAAARNLLLYRHQTLPQAMERAKELDLDGACYPIATLNGKEACALWQHASLQMQPSTAVAYAIELYAHLTDDKAFLKNEGAQMLAQIARYCVSRGDWNQDKTGFGFYGVMGPDEFHLMVNNNFYTNFMGKRALCKAADVLENAPDIRARLHVTDDEIAYWRLCADKMLLERRGDGVYPQHEGYFNLPHIDVHAIPQNEFPLYHHWSYDRIYRTDMIKQPDVLMAMFLHPADFSLQEMAANYDYYEPRCIHESSLSPSIHSVFASWLKRDEEAARFFGFATRLDLDNYNNNTGEGLHTTSLAAAWVTIVYGFLGLKVDGQHIALSPRLPKGWTHIKLKLTLFGRQIAVNAEPDGTRLTLLKGEPLTILLDDKDIWLQ